MVRTKYMEMRYAFFLGLSIIFDQVVVGDYIDRHGLPHALNSSCRMPMKYNSLSSWENNLHWSPFGLSG